MSPDGPAGVRRQQRGPVAVKQDEPVHGASDPGCDGAVEVGVKRLGTTSASGHRVQQTRWMSTDLPGLAISQSRRVAACWAARAARSSPRSRTVSSATSSIRAKFPDQLAMAAEFPTYTERRPPIARVSAWSNRAPGMSARGREEALSSIPGQVLYIADRRVPLLRSPPETSGR